MCMFNLKFKLKNLIKTNFGGIISLLILILLLLIAIVLLNNLTNKTEQSIIKLPNQEPSYKAFTITSNYDDYSPNDLSQLFLFFAFKFV